MDSRLLEYFLRVAELGSINKAAADLHLSQPALSRHVAALEHEMGTKLFNRSQGGVQLTDAGNLLSDRARPLLRQFTMLKAQIGEKADIKVADDEVRQALVERVRQFPGQERQVWEFYQKNPQALAEIRAPLYEEKVVDHILGQVQVKDETVSKDALFSDDEADEADSKPKGGKKASE